MPKGGGKGEASDGRGAWRRSTLALAATLLASTVIVLLVAKPTYAAVPPQVSSTFDSITAESRYANSTWGWDVVDMATGESLYSHNAKLQFDPGSIIKDYTAATILDALGPRHRFKTPVYAQGRTRRKVLDGNLVLVGSGDFSFGLRDGPNDTLKYTNFDHNESGTLPFARLVHGDPLAGLRRLAREVRESGIRRVKGDIVVDNRLFKPYDEWPDGRIDSIWVNENLIDIKVTPTSPGKRAKVAWRPHTSAYRVISKVTTKRRGTTPDLAVEYAGDGVIEVRGQIASDSDRQLENFEVPDPARFARTAFIDELEQAGVRVDAATLAPNRPRRLPSRGDYRSRDRVAELVSPPLSEYVKVVLKVSYNRGAQLFGCLVVVASGGRDCDDAAGAIMATTTSLGVSPGSTFVFDPAGSVDDARTTPRDMADFHRQVAAEPYGAALEAGLPVLGRDGSLATTLQDSPAAGHVFAKTGTRATTTPDARTLLLGQTLVGYVETKGGRKLAFALMMNDMPLLQFDDILDVFQDQGSMAAALYEGY